MHFCKLERELYCTLIYTGLQWNFCITGTIGIILIPYLKRHPYHGVAYKFIWGTNILYMFGLQGCGGVDQDIVNREITV